MSEHKPTYMENWQALSGLLMILGVMIPAFMVGRIPEGHWWWYAIGSIPLLIGAILMWRIKAVEWARDRLLNQHPRLHSHCRSSNSD